DSLPSLSASTQAVVRTGYGALLLLTLVQALPEARRFFLSERWGGYAESRPTIDAVQNPLVLPALLAIWFAAAACLTVGWWTVAAATVNLALCRYFFVHMRWKGVLRGMGAPGFYAYWLGLAVCLLEYTSQYAAALRPFALLVVQADVAFIILSAGIYKFTAGYPRNEGMELGMANPMWGYWWRYYVGMTPRHPWFWFLNQMAWGTEVVAALLMLLPPTRELGGLLLAASFLFILTHIRLGFLCEMVALSGLYFVHDGGLVDGWLRGLVGPQPPAAVPTLPLDAAGTALGLALLAYLLLLPLAHAGLAYNFYMRRRLPGMLQAALERYTNLFGIIIWRVFSVDLINFFVRVTTEPTPGGTRTEVAPLGSWPRFNHVGEMICLASLFTTLKYYPSQDARFRDRVLRYARTVPRTSRDLVVFEYYSVSKQRDRFEWRHVADYRVDLATRTVEERILEHGFSPHAAHAVSPVHEGVTPGSYAPLSQK
ncbi:MAG TPA: hypothetical protein VIY56_02655, partial [Vicinamibacterales bacterium]